MHSKVFMADISFGLMSFDHILVCTVPNAKCKMKNERILHILLYIPSSGLSSILLLETSIENGKIEELTHFLDLVTAERWP